MCFIDMKDFLASFLPFFFFLLQHFLSRKYYDTKVSELKKKKKSSFITKVVETVWNNLWEHREAFMKDLWVMGKTVPLIQQIWEWRKDGDPGGSHRVCDAAWSSQNEIWSEEKTNQ